MIAIPEIGREGIAKLRKSVVAVIGCGALGSLCSMYLAGAGIGTIKIADFDTIDLSNLQRQLFFDSSHLGESKASVLSSRLHNLNPGCKVIENKSIITERNIREFLNDADFIIDATDNPDSKFLIDNICSELGKGYCIGGVSEFTGQVMSWEPGRTRYSEIFSSADNSSGVTPCSIGGVLGPAAGVVASLQAAETLKHIIGCGEMLLDRIFTINLLTMQTQLLPLS